MKNNLVELNGKLTQDIQLTKNNNGNSYVRFSLACTRDGKKPWTDFISCVAFDEKAEELCRNNKKDTPYHIHGNLRTSTYERNGQKVYSTSVVVDELELINE